MYMYTTLFSLFIFSSRVIGWQSLAQVAHRLSLLFDLLFVRL
jgi:hypothetical protein